MGQKVTCPALATYMAWELLLANCPGKAQTGVVRTQEGRHPPHTLQCLLQTGLLRGGTAPFPRPQRL